jgi:hypothetical protein
VTEARERTAKRLHAAVIVVAALGAAAWLWRAYGFAPLRLVSPAGTAQAVGR